MQRILGLTAVLMIGCVAGAATAHLVVPPARAGSTGTKWEYDCLVNVELYEQDGIKKLNKYGAEGWELVGLSGMGNLGQRNTACFKRPLP